MVAAGLAAVATPAQAAPASITNGTQFTDTSGNGMHAHGGGVIQVDDYFYLFGENRNADDTFKAVSVYRSRDLRTWEYRGDALTSASAGELNSAKIERPKVVYNATTRKFVMWMHKENGTDYTEARAAVATSDTVDGTYTYHGSFRPFGTHMSRDITLFNDNGTAYMLSAADENKDMHIYRLTPDFLNVETLVGNFWNDQSREAPAMFKRGSTYFLLTSGTSYWFPNQAKYATAPSIAGPWTAMRNVGDATTFGSQPTFVLPIQGRSTTSYLYLGDRWAGAWNEPVNNSQYVWLPIGFPTSTTMSLSWYPSVTVDTVSGAVTGTPPSYHRLTNRASGKVMDTVSASTANNAEVRQYTWNGGDTQRWEFQLAEPGYLRIVNQGSGKCLDVGDASTADGANVVQYACGNGKNQQWQWTAVDGYHQLKARHSGKCLEVAGTATGTDIQQITCGNATSQQWSRTVPPPGMTGPLHATNTVTVRVDPSYQQKPFEGWGTSLVWFANATGGYPEPIRRKLADLVFGRDGLNLNIARYNIGGGNAPDVRTDYMKQGATMPGFWKAPAGTTHADKDWWNPDNPQHWNFAADANQRWWVDQIKRKVTKWEAFSNSPPYFQTVSGYVSGGFSATTDQIRPDKVDEFATYLVEVAERLERAHGIKFDTINPLNEPNTDYWGTTLGTDGQPTGGRQEGAHAGPESQQAVLLALRKKLTASGSRMTVSAMDETNPGVFMTDWNAYGPDARAAVGQMNVHTYGTGSRTSVRDAAKGAGKPLWMSEVEGDWGGGTTDYTSMLSGLGMATRMVDDMRELEPSAWVFWQPIEDSVPQQAGNGNWGSIHIPFNCTAKDTLATCPIQTNTKFDTIRNFTHYLRPGDRFVKVDDTSSVAAIKPSGDEATVVHVNNATENRNVVLDLTRFTEADNSATVTPVTSSRSGALVRGKPVRVSDGTATLVVPAQSVTTLLVDGVSGVARDAALIQRDHVYRLRGVASGRLLAPSADSTGVVLRTAVAGATDQLWSVSKLTKGNGNRERYAVTTAAGSTRLAVRGGALVLESTAGVSDAPAQWMMSTTGDGSWTLVNVGTGGLVDVSDNATADGSKVSTWVPTSGANQRWTLTDETVLRTSTVRAYTVPGRAPVLPTTVTPVYADGARGTLPVTWALPAESKWHKAGTVVVPGTATDLLGREHKATAVVVVDTFTGTVPARAKTYADGQPALPATVIAIGRAGGRAELPVTWQTPAPGAFGQVGVVTVDGTAQVVDGSTVKARAQVQVTEAVQTNVAVESGVTVAATYTESGYSAAGLRNGNLAEKAWSNWRSGTKNTSDTITYTLPAARDLTRVVTHFYKDGNNISFPASLRVQARAADGTWADASTEVPVGTEGTPVVDVPVTTAGPVSEVRVVMTIRPGGYVTASEIEVFAKTGVRSPDASLSAIEVNGTPVPRFRPDTLEYRVRTERPALALVTGTATDPGAQVTAEPEADGKQWRITVHSEDGTNTRQYRVNLC
jgi:O-glycosyl hydrolase